MMAPTISFVHRSRGEPLYRANVEGSGNFGIANFGRVADCVDRGAMSKLFQPVREQHGLAGRAAIRDEVGNKNRNFHAIECTPVESITRGSGRGATSLPPRARKSFSRSCISGRKCQGRTRKSLA